MMTDAITYLHLNGWRQDQPIHWGPDGACYGLYDPEGRFIDLYEDGTWKLYDSSNDYEHPIHEGLGVYSLKARLTSTFAR